MGSSRQETREWLQTYGDEAQRQRRREAMPRKLRLLGLDRAPRASRILDLCCGTGEALETLHELGFQSLAGVDLNPPAGLLSDARFQVAAGSASRLSHPDESFDWVLIIHALHHLGTPEQIAEVIAECHRVLKPGGRLGVIDFPNSPQIRLAFFLFRQNYLLRTPYLRYFGKLIQEEWPFLREYLPRFSRVRKILERGRFNVEAKTNELFYFYLTLRKP